MDLNNITLEDWLNEAPKEIYPFGKKVDFYSPYKTLKDLLNRDVHKQVTVGANLKDPDMLINDHGPDHIDTVIERASLLVCSKKCILTPLEIYILLVSIQLHDVGNIFGRYQHELNVHKIMQEALKLCGRDTIEQIIIKSIAEAHGGEIRGLSQGKDKISLLKEKEPLLDGIVHTRVIASILRFADELADDKRRASTLLLRQKGIPKKSEVFHAYASCLDVVLINHEGKSVELYYKIPKDFTTMKFGKGNEEIYLLDEIYNRVMKMHLERIYFMRFCRKQIELDKITVFINFYDQFLDVFRPLSFEVREAGYPQATENGIYDLCPSLKDDAGYKIDGEYVKNHIIGAK